MKSKDKKIVISQPMYFPWIGLLEQIKSSDIFVHYDDVQFSKGFLNRVQIKTNAQNQWLTVPLKKHHREAHINEIQIDTESNWKKKHREFLRHSYNNALHCDEMLAIVDNLFSEDIRFLSDLSIKSVEILANYFELVDEKKFFKSSDLDILGNSSARLFDVCCHFNCNYYITGHGAKNYLDHNLFEKNGIQVHYMNYSIQPYTQLHGDFTPYVSSLDLIANCGKEGIKHITPKTIHWRSFTNQFN
jgi:hypothetical protein